MKLRTKKNLFIFLKILNVLLQIIFVMALVAGFLGGFFYLMFHPEIFYWVFIGFIFLFMCGNVHGWIFNDIPCD